MVGAKYTEIEPEDHHYNHVNDDSNHNLVSLLGQSNEKISQTKNVSDFISSSLSQFPSITIFDSGVAASIANGDARPATAPGNGDARPATAPGNGDARPTTAPGNGDARPPASSDNRIDSRANERTSQVNDCVPTNLPRLDRAPNSVLSGGTGNQAWRLETWINQDGSYAIRDTRQGGDFQRLNYADANGTRGEFYIRQQELPDGSKEQMINVNLPDGSYRIIASSIGWGVGRPGAFAANSETTISPNNDRVTRTLAGTEADQTIARFRELIGPYNNGDSRAPSTNSNDSRTSQNNDNLPDVPNLRRAPDRVLRGGTGNQAWTMETWNNADGSFAIRDTWQGGNFQRLNYADANGRRAEIYLRQNRTVDGSIGEQMVNVDLGNGRSLVVTNHLGWGTGHDGAFAANSLLTLNPDGSRPQTILPGNTADRQIANYIDMINGNRVRQ